MKRSTLLVFSLLAVPTVALPVLSQTKPTAAQKKVKAQDSAKTQKAKSTQSAKAAQSAVAKLPAGIGGTWAIDPQHSRIGFAVRHLMINDVRGSFNDFEGTVVVDEKDISKSSVDFKAKIASIDTNVPQRDGHLKSPDFFDAEKFPEMTFKSKKVMRAGAGFRVMGTFTMHGVSRDIIIPFSAMGPVVDGFGYTRSSVKANFEINRQDYGVKWNQTLDNGGLAVDNVVRVELDLEAVKAGSGPKKPA